MSRRSRKRKPESEDQAVADGEQDNFFPDEKKNEMETMWEIPQISHFLHLTKESLNVPQFSIYEMERMLLIPRASKQLANIMTSLLSSPITKAKLRKVPPMPYEFWTNILAHKMTSWFKVYHAKHRDATKVLETIGVEPEFWNIFPDGSLLDGKDFEDLSVKQRVWLLKTVCDTIMHTRKTVQEDIAKQPWEDQFETVLGFDRDGARYVYFPQFVSSDLRIYRHRLDNKILSTVKPVRSKQVANSKTSDLIGARFDRYRKGKSRTHNGSSARSNARENRLEDKDLGNCRCNNDSVTSSFISEDTNLSSTSTCNNNNNISLDAMDGKRCRSSSKTSEKSALSSAKSSGYDTNTSSDKFLDDNDRSQKMFKGFTNTQDDNCNIGIINEMLDDLKSEIDEERRTHECRSDTKSNESNGRLAKPEEDFVGSYKSSTADVSCVETPAAERNERDRSFDSSLSSSSKTDDEKLNEIISAENSKLPENTCSKSISISISNVDDNISTFTSKSDDEKLSETKSSDSNISAIDEKNDMTRDVTFNGSFCASSGGDSASLSEKVKHKHFDKAKVSPSIVEACLNDSVQLQSHCKTMQRNEDKTVEEKEDVELEDAKVDDSDDKTSSSSETRLQDATEDDLEDYMNNSDIGYNLRRSKQPQTDEYKQHFNSMLSDLGVSDFQLVVDSVEGLRDLISSFSASDSKINNTDNVEAVPVSTCEVKLVKKLTELLSSLETVETTLKDATRKARSKLQREWSNFKEGIVEDQDSSGEGGLSSNWWVLGSQGCPLSAPGDATLQTLPQSALSPSGTQNQQPRHERGPGSERESAGKSADEQQSRRESRENGEQQNNSSSDSSSSSSSSSDSTEKPKAEKKQGRKQAKGNEQKRERKQQGENETANNDVEDAEQQTRRVLRARGVSSYTEQFYSDYESDKDELEEWTDVEAVYAAPGAPADTSAAYADTKVRHADDWSETEDSDQDWILPSSRKRKNKRSSANRRLKSLQHKLQNLKENASQNNVVSSIPHPASVKAGKDKPRDNREGREPGARTPSNCATRVSGGGNANDFAASASNANTKQAAPSSSSTICKIEAIGSVHSVLDIKDEGAIYAPEPNYSYGPNPQQNYMMIKADSNLQPVNYYVMPQNPPSVLATGVIPPQPGPMTASTVVTGIAQPIQQGYYVQGAPDYMLQNPQPNFLPATTAQQQQQPVFHQQDQRMLPQSFVNNAAYVPYVVATTQSTQGAGYNMVAGPTRPLMANHHPQQQHRYAGQQSRYTAPRAQNPPHPNSAALRGGSAPVRGSCHRPANPKSARGNVPQQGRGPTSATRAAAPRQRQATQTPVAAESGGGHQKTMSVIVLSDSDDEIEMIVTENSRTRGTPPTPTPADRARQTAPPRRTVSQTAVRQQPAIISDITVPPSTRDIIPPQILERMNQGGISITPVKSTTSTASAPTSANTQLVVVVNETGSHYALALPNGSKLILTPEQVAQIRASNGGKLIL